MSITRAGNDMPGNGCPGEAVQMAAAISIGFIGFGAIAKRVLGVLEQNAVPFELTAILDRPEAGRDPSYDSAYVEGRSELLGRRPGLVVECAGHAALAMHGPAILESGTDLAIASIGALADPVLEETLAAAARKGRSRLVLPSGAVGALDALGAMRLAGKIDVTYRSRKPPLAWRGTPAEGLCDLAQLTSARLFYRGNAREAATNYPKNANVAAAIALAGSGFDATRVELIADPAVTTNIHEIEASGPTGRFQITLDGNPDPANPKTSMLTAYSLVKVVLDQAKLAERR